MLVQARNGNPLFASMFACFRLGAVWVPTHARLTPGEAAALAQAGGVAALICGTEFPDHATAVRAAIRTALETQGRLPRDGAAAPN